MSSPQTANSQPETVIKQGIRRNFARRAGSYDGQAGVQRLMAQRLLGLLSGRLPRSGRILEIGCGTGHFTQVLKEASNGAFLMALDLDAALVAAARRRLGVAPGMAWLVADGETLSRGRFEAIVANAAFQWFTHPAETIAAYFHLLSPGGVLAFSTLGPGTFRELRDSLERAAAAQHLPGPPAIAAQDFLDEACWSRVLTAAGFPWIRLVREWVTADYPSVPGFLKALQTMGVTNPQPRPFSPRLFKAMVQAYRDAYGPKGSIPVSYEIIWAVALKGRGQESGRPGAAGGEPGSGPS